MTSLKTPKKSIVLSASCAINKASEEFNCVTTDSSCGQILASSDPDLLALNKPPRGLSVLQH